MSETYISRFDRRDRRDIWTSQRKQVQISGSLSKIRTRELELMGLTANDCEDPFQNIKSDRGLEE